MAYQDDIKRQLTEQGYLPENFTQSEDDSTLLQSIQKYMQTGQWAGGRYSGEEAPKANQAGLAALQGLGVSNDYDARGLGLTRNGKQYMLPNGVDVSQLPPGMVINDPQYGPLIDSLAYYNTFGSGESGLNKAIGIGLQAGMMGGVGALGATGAGLAGAAEGTATGGASAGLPESYWGATAGGVTSDAAPLAAGTIGAEGSGAAGATGAFDMGGSAGTGLEFGMQPGPATADGFSIGPGQTAAAGAAAAGIGPALSGVGSSNTTFGIPNNILSGAAQGIGGLLASNATGNAYGDVANQYLNIGAPYRGQLDASYKPGFDLASQPGYGDAFKRMADISSRSYSSKFGNPADSPTAQAGILGDVWNQGYLPALTNYRGQLGQFGGLGLNTSGSASMGQAGAPGTGWEAIGAGVGTALGSNNSLAAVAKKYGLSVGGLSFKE